MIIDITKMFNYQLICNESYVVGTIHSYVPSMISLNLQVLPLMKTISLLLFVTG